MYSRCNHQIGIISIALCWGLSQSSASFETDSKLLWTTELLKLFLPPRSTSQFVIQLLAAFVASGNPILSPLWGQWFRLYMNKNRWHLSFWAWLISLNNLCSIHVETNDNSGLRGGGRCTQFPCVSECCYPLSIQLTTNAPAPLLAFPFWKLKLGQVWGCTPVRPGGRSVEIRRSGSAAAARWALHQTLSHKTKREADEIAQWGTVLAILKGLSSDPQHPQKNWHGFISTCKPSPVRGRDGKRDSACSPSA